MKREKPEELVKLAESIAREAHTGAIRKFGADKDKPYIVHPERVAAKLDYPVLKAAGWLHDVVEDTKITFQDLLDRGIWPEVVDILKYVTKKEGENYKDFMVRISRSKFAMQLKKADLEDNLESCPEGQMKDKYRLALWLIDILSMKLFAIEGKELEDWSKWYEKHNKKCPHSKGEGLGAIGGRFTYCFTPNGLGTTVIIKCACGKEVNVTNVDDW